MKVLSAQLAERAFFFCVTFDKQLRFTDVAGGYGVLHYTQWNRQGRTALTSRTACQRGVNKNAFYYNIGERGAVNSPFVQVANTGDFASQIRWIILPNKRAFEKNVHKFTKNSAVLSIVL